MPERTPNSLGDVRDWLMLPRVGELDKLSSEAVERFVRLVDALGDGWRSYCSRPLDFRMVSTLTDGPVTVSLGVTPVEGSRRYKAEASEASDLGRGVWEYVSAPEDVPAALERCRATLLGGAGG